MCWRHHTSLDTRPWYSGNQFIELYIHSPTTPSSYPFPTLFHPASGGRKAASRVLTAPSPPSSPMHKSSARRPCLSALSGSKVTVLDLLLQLDYIFLYSALSSPLLLQPSYNNFLGSADENASSCSRVCGLLPPWSAACEPYYPQYRCTELVLCEQSR
jgi:hypothetical protein